MIITDRRQLIATASLGVAAAAVPAGRAFAQLMADARGFTHGVASGEPGSDSMLLWTRYVGAGDRATVRAEVSDTPDFRRVLSGGQAITGAWRDWTVKLTVDGLPAGRRLFYRFIAADGAVSMIGHTRTLPEGRTTRFGLGVFSCANLPFGYFNAYGHAAQRDDIDLWMHLGDYLYEYPRGNYPAPSQAVRMAALEPAHEILQIADYRARYAAYRADPDLQRLHAMKPMIGSMDDHESANDSWEGGAQNHEAREGDWNVRRAAAYQVYREWMPISEEPWKAYQIGDLATLYRTDTRLIARSPIPDLRALTGTGAVEQAVVRFRDGAWQDPAATMMGSTQESWLSHGILASARARTRWQVVGFGTIMGRGMTPPESASWLAPDAPDYVKAYVAAGLAASRAGLPFNMDAWGGYPAARARFLKTVMAAGANGIVLSGDSHNAWAWELGQDGHSAAVEFSGHSVSSPGYEGNLRQPPETVARAFVAASPELKWAETSRRGYMALQLTPAAATNEWVFMSTIRERTLATQPSHRMRVAAGTRRLGPA